MNEKKEIIGDLDFMSWGIYTYLRTFGARDIRKSINEIAQGIKIKADMVARKLKSLRSHNFIKIFIPDNYEEECIIEFEMPKKNLEPDEEAFNWLRDKWLNHTACAISYMALQRIEFIATKAKLEDIKKIWFLMERNNRISLRYLEQQLFFKPKNREILKKKKGKKDGRNRNYQKRYI